MPLSTANALPAYSKLNSSVYESQFIRGIELCRRSVICTPYASINLWSCSIACPAKVEKSVLMEMCTGC